MAKDLFPKDRVLTFNDAIFSIAITLLILEIDVPNQQMIEQYGMLAVLSNLIPSFIGFFVSFMVIAIYWIAHLKFSKFNVQYDRKLLWLNIFLLLFVVLLPFSTAFYVNSFNLNGPFMWYAGNLVLLSLFDYSIARIILKRTKQNVSAFRKKAILFKAFNGGFFWLLALVLAPFLPILISRLLFILIFLSQPLAEFIIRKIILKKKKAKRILNRAKN